MIVSAMHQDELPIGIHVSPPSRTSLSRPYPPLPSSLSQSTGFGFPESYLKLPLAICLTDGSVYVSMLLTVSNQPTLSSPHRIQKSILYVSVSFTALHVGPSF